MWPSYATRHPKSSAEKPRRLSRNRKEQHFALGQNIGHGHGPFDSKEEGAHDSFIEALVKMALACLKIDEGRRVGNLEFVDGRTLQCKGDEYPTSVTILKDVHAEHKNGKRRRGDVPTRTPSLRSSSLLDPALTTRRTR